MEELQLLSRQKPGEVIIDNFQELREELSGVLNRYEHLVYTDDMLADAKADKKELTRLRRELDDRRKEVKRAYLAPYNAFEGQVKDLLAMIDAPLEEIKGFIASMEEREKAARRQEIEAYFRIPAPVHPGSDYGVYQGCLREQLHQCDGAAAGLQESELRGL